MKIYQKKTKSCISKFLYQSNFRYSFADNKQHRTESTNQLQNDIDYQLKHFFKNRSNMISEREKSMHILRNREQFNKIENIIWSAVTKQTGIENFVHISKYLNLISSNDDLKHKFLHLFLENMNRISLGPVLETSWYFCLDDSTENKKKLYQQLMRSYLTEKLDSSFSLNFSTSYKVMLSQIRFDALHYHLDLLSQVKGIDNIELLSLEEIPVNIYHTIGDKLQELGITVLNTNRFFEIYNLGIELDHKIILDLWKKENKEINSVFKLIRLHHLKRSGFEPLPLIIKNPKDYDINEICKSINEFQSKIKTT